MVGDIRRPDEPRILHSAVGPPPTSGLHHPLEPAAAREILRVRV